MKKVKQFKKSIIFLMVFILAFGSLNASAAVTYRSGSKNVRYTGASYKVYYNSKRINNLKTPGVYVNGNLMIPYYKTLVKNGPKVSYSKDTSINKLALSYNGKTVVLYLNKKYMYVNSVKKTLRTAPFMANISGTKLIMVPAKAVCKALGIDYTYNLKRKAIYMTGKAQTTSVSAATSTLKASAFKSMNTTQFINALGPVARTDYKKTGVLASVTLAQAINESGWGKSSLTQSSNNMFGMKTSLSGNNWTGSTWDGSSYVSVRTREEYSGKKVTITAKFRKYSSVAQSVSDHSAYLVNAKNGSSRRYAGLTGTASYTKQLTILQKGGYCTWSGYVSELTALIKKYNLTKWDK